MQFYDVGLVLASHGLKGEVTVKLITDFPTERFQPGTQLHLQTNADQVLTVASSRPFKGGLLVQFAEVTSVSEADALRQETLTIAASDREPLAAGSYFFEDIIGCQVLDAMSGEKLGLVSAIEQPGGNDIWEITEANGHHFWLPVVDQFVKQVDIATKTIRVELIAGLRDED